MVANDATRQFGQRDRDHGLGCHVRVLPGQGQQLPDDMTGPLNAGFEVGNRRLGFLGGFRPLHQLRLQLHCRYRGAQFMGRIGDECPLRGQGFPEPP